MWAVIKYKKKEYKSLVVDLKQRVGDKIIFYNPKIKYLKKTKNKNQVFENFILGGYAFCFYEKFQEKKFLSQLSFTKGLEYFLEGHIQNQNQTSINNFPIDLDLNDDFDKTILIANIFLKYKFRVFNMLKFLFVIIFIVIILLRLNIYKN